MDREECIKAFEEYKKEAQERIKDMPFPVKKVSQ